MIELDAARVAEFGRLLAASGRQRVDSRSLWGAFAAAFPSRPQGIEERRWLSAALEQLANQGIVRFPAKGGRRWDKTFGTPLPLSIDLPRNSPPPTERRWRSYPWDVRLAWVASLRALRSDQERFLLKVQEGLVNDWFRDQAPLKYRSLQLTGSEKRLAAYLRTPLFAEGRLSLQLLGAYAEVLPLAWAPVGSAPSVIIFENAGPFFVAHAVLSGMEHPPYGLVAYGGGKGILASLPHIATLGRAVEAIHYVGDLDLHGMAIATAARKIAERRGLPPVVPAPGIHKKMLEAAKTLGAPDGWAISKKRDDARLRDALAFLPENVRTPILGIIRAGRRVPEEVLGPKELRSLWSQETT